MNHGFDPDAHDTGVAQIVERVEAIEQVLTGIRQTLDGIRDDIAWWLTNNRKNEWIPIQPLTSMPQDPLAPDWAERLNRYSSHTPPNEVPAPQSPVSAAPRAESSPDFCCEAPDLQWTGAPDFPGIACANCGYTAVDCGSVVMTPAPADPGGDAPPAPSRSPQQELF